MLEYISAVLWILVIALFVIMFRELRHDERQAEARAVRLASRKHVRTCLHSDHVVLAYYGENGRKVTVRRYPLHQYSRVTQAARAKGYRVI